MDFNVSDVQMYPILSIILFFITFGFNQVFFSPDPDYRNRLDLVLKRFQQAL